MSCVQTSAWKRAILIEGFRGVSQPFQENVSRVPQFKPRQFPSTDLSNSLFTDHQNNWRSVIWATNSDKEAISNAITGLDRPSGFQEVEAPRFQDSRHLRVVRLSALRTGRLYPRRKYSWYSFLLEAESTPGPYCGRKDNVSEKFQRHHRESNPRPSGL